MNDGEATYGSMVPPEVSAPVAAEEPEEKKEDKGVKREAPEHVKVPAYKEHKEEHKAHKKK